MQRSEIYPAFLSEFGHSEDQHRQSLSVLRYVLVIRKKAEGRCSAAKSLNIKGNLHYSPARISVFPFNDMGISMFPPSGFCVIILPSNDTSTTPERTHPVVGSTLK